MVLVPGQRHLSLLPYLGCSTTAGAAVGRDLETVAKFVTCELAGGW